MSAVETQVSDDMLHNLIAQHAKPTLTLAQLKSHAASLMDENEMRMSLGRLWRSLRIFRCAVNTQVVYWTEGTARAAAASGLQPELPEGVEQPECTFAPSGPKPKLDVAKVLGQDFTAVNREEKAMVNKALSRGLLIPISQTAAIPMRPQPEGEFGNLRRGGITAQVATAMFMYRDVKLSVDGAVLICKDLSRVDVSRVLSQLCTENPGKDYLKRIPGATKFDSSFQWNDKYCYPFSSRLAEDGCSVERRNVDTETKDDDKLDHIPPAQLTETETETEIARLIAAQTQEQKVIDTPEENPKPKDVAQNIVPQKLTVPDDKFDASINLAGKLLMTLDGTPIELSKDQTDALIDLLGPIYYVWKQK